MMLSTCNSIHLKLKLKNPVNLLKDLARTTRQEEEGEGGGKGDRGGEGERGKGEGERK